MTTLAELQTMYVHLDVTDRTGIITIDHPPANALNSQLLDELAAAFGAALADPQVKVAGAQVQRMITGGQEVIAGVTRDPQFGPLIMFGSGGVEVEGLQDVAFDLAPLTRAAALRLLQETWVGKKLAGYRNIPAVDETGTVDILIRLGQMAVDLPQLAEIEINPLLVVAGGATAVDVRARLDRSGI